MRCFSVAYSCVAVSLCVCACSCVRARACKCVCVYWGVPPPHFLLLAMLWTPEHRERGESEGGNGALSLTGYS